MSMKLMVRVMEEIDVTRPQQLVLLSMAENARDDGSKCFPSVDLIAWKAGYKPRAVSDIMRDLRRMGVLEVTRQATAHLPTEYHIHLDKAPKKMSFEEWQKANGRYAERGTKIKLARENASLNGEIARENASQGCNLTGQGVQSHVLNAEIARENAPEPVIEPNKNQGEPDGSLRIVPDSKPAVQGDTPAHHMVNAWYRIVGGHPTNHGKDIGHANTLIRAGLTIDQLGGFVPWLRTTYFGRDGIDLRIAVQCVNQWTSKESAPAPVKRLVV